jgi:replication factor A1
MYAEIPQQMIGTMDSFLQIDGTYVISRFRVNAAKATYKPLNGRLMIEFTEFTLVQIAENPPNTFPEYIYALTSFQNIAPSQGPVATLTG